MQVLWVHNVKLIMHLLVCAFSHLSVSPCICVFFVCLSLCLCLLFSFCICPSVCLSVPIFLSLCDSGCLLSLPYSVVSLCLCVILCISVFVSLCYLLSVFSFPLCSVSLSRQLNSCQIFLEEDSGVCYNYTNSQPTEGSEPTTQVFLPILRKGQLETRINEGLILIFFKILSNFFPWPIQSFQDDHVPESQQIQKQGLSLGEKKAGRLTVLHQKLFNFLRNR